MKKWSKWSPCLAALLAAACSSDTKTDATSDPVNPDAPATAPGMQTSTPPVSGIPGAGESAQGSGTIRVTPPAGETTGMAAGSACTPIAPSSTPLAPPPKPGFLTGKTPYQPQQDLATYEAPPAGFAPIFTELVSRHGSRGLGSFEDDAIAYAMWQRASAESALTPIGEKLGPDILRLIRANTLLGSGVKGISEPGYGNLTEIGIAEHQQLAARLLQRLPEYFADLGASAATSPRTILVLSSGVDRAVDSAAFFADALATKSPALSGLITQPPAPAGYPAGAPVDKPAGTNRFLLYFHKLNPELDLVTDPSDPFFQTYQSSLLYQDYKDGPEVSAKLEAIQSDPGVVAAARQMLERLFSKAFVDGIEAGTYSFDNTARLTFSSDDCAHTAETSVEAGDDPTVVDNLVDAALTLYGLYAIAPALWNETRGADFTAYMPPEDAAVFSYLDDADDFYNKGPGITENSQTAYAMAQGLLNDFFSEVDAVAAGDLSHGAKLRFTHAEIIIPFTSLLGLDDVFTPVPAASLYTYKNNTWRAENVAPMAANVQWDVYRDAKGSLLIRMLRNEKETAFKSACDQARVGSDSFYYDYVKLAACYGHVPQ